MAVRKQPESQKKEQDLKPDYKILEEICSKYLKEAFNPVGGETSYRVQTQLKILREFCATTNKSFRIIPRFIDVGQATRTVGITVEVLNSSSEIVWESFGISTRYTFTLASKVKDAATEAAQTVALGKALSLLGITPNNNITYSAEEMELFENVKQKVDPQVIKAKAAELIAKLPEDYKKRMRYANLGIDTILDIIDVERDDINTLIERLGALLENQKGPTLNNVPSPNN